jgi:hypothetical protein
VGEGKSGLGSDGTGKLDFFSSCTEKDLPKRVRKERTCIFHAGGEKNPKWKMILLVTTHKSTKNRDN